MSNAYSSTTIRRGTDAPRCVRLLNMARGTVAHLEAAARTGADVEAELQIAREHYAAIDARIVA